MLEHAQARVRRHARRSSRREDELEPADYTVASGIFNVKLDVPDEDWREYVLETLEAIARLSTRGLRLQHAHELLRRRTRCATDLYYGDPRFFFDHCKREYSRARRAAARLRALRVHDRSSALR